MEFDDSSSTFNLGLCLGMNLRPQANNHKKLLLMNYDGRSENNKLKSAAKKNKQASPMSALSPLSSISNDLDEDKDGSPRKKLRLTKQQFASLEETFKQQITLNPKQKQALAEKLNLRARQVEVWFQNRRARNKSKQSEVECELLKRCCEELTEENKRLQREAQEIIKSMNLSSPLNLQLHVATLLFCPSCERLGCAADGNSDHDGDGNGCTTSSFTYLSQPLYDYLVTHPSAASC